jgi:PAS domain S-box-containing protein
VLLEILEIIGLTIAFTLGVVIVYFFRYYFRFYKEPEEFKKSYTFVLLVLLALIFHNLHHLLKSFGAIGSIFEIISGLIFIGTMLNVTRTALHFEITTEVQKGKGLKKLMAVGNVRDKLNATTKELIDTKNFFDNIIQSSADAIVASDNQKKITYFSKGAEGLFELSAKDILGSNVLDLYPKEIRLKKDRLKRAKELRRVGSIKNILMKIYTPSKVEKTISLSLSLLKDSNGRVKGTVGVAKDITDEKKAADEIRYLKELKEKILDGTPDGLILLDLDFNVAMVNNGFERITGIKKEKIEEKNALEYLKIKEVNDLFEAMDAKQKFITVTYNKKTLEPSEFTVTLNGDNKTITDYWTPLLNSKGQVEVLLIILHDVTKRKNLEEDLRKQADMLQRYAPAL